MNWIYLIAFLSGFVLVLRLLKKPLTPWLLRMRGKLFVGSLRNAINEADKDKKQTGRKNIVVFNTESESFEPAQKRLLKFLASKGKNKNNAKKTDGRKKFAKPLKRKLDHDQVSIIEKKSLYVTN